MKMNLLSNKIKSSWATKRTCATLKSKQINGDENLTLSIADGRRSSIIDSLCISPTQKPEFPSSDTFPDNNKSIGLHKN